MSNNRKLKGRMAEMHGFMLHVNQAIENAERLTEREERELIRLFESQQTHWRIMLEYMEEVYPGERWPKLEACISDVIKSSLETDDASSMPCSLKSDEHRLLFKIIEPYFKHIGSADWLLEILDNLCDETGRNYFIFPICYDRYTSPDRLPYSKSYDYLLDRALEMAYAKFIGRNRLYITQQLWAMLLRPTETRLYDWALEENLYYFKGSLEVGRMGARNKTEFTFLDLIMTGRGGPVLLSRPFNADEFKRLFEPFTFEDFLEEPELIIPYCKFVLKGRYYDIENFLKKLNPEIYDRYMKEVQENTF